jgi:hypothetical protein
MSDDHLQVLAKLRDNRMLAHDLIFRARHPQATPKFHVEMLELWYSAKPFVLTMAFRGSAKSTLAEEAIILTALFRECRNILIVGESYARACDRLRAIKREFEMNETIVAVFGEQVGETWQEQRIVLPSGVAVQAMGQGQSLRGVKHLDARPDLVFIDDLESEDTVATPEAREKLSHWFYAALLPAMDASNRRVRIAATPLDPEALAVRLSRDENWLSKTFPIEYVDENGETKAMWPERYSLDWIADERARYTRAGKSRVWAQEYECVAVDPASRIFTDDMLRCEPRVRTWRRSTRCTIPRARSRRLRRQPARLSAPG